MKLVSRNLACRTGMLISTCILQMLQMLQMVPAAHDDQTAACLKKLRALTHVHNCAFIL